jgi:soluble lytic murein transglycosylase-like protein
MRSGYGQRGMALLQIGEIARAQHELLQLVPDADTELLQALLTVSQQAGLPGLALKLGAGFDDATDAAAYPVPAWEPDGGFTVDRALVFAFARLESAFNPKAVNPSGASGLMQLMPRTAGIVSGKETAFLGKNRKKLLDPETNLALGQRYIEKLLDDPAVDGDLLRVAAAYNAGPGNLAKWREELEEEDPLLFLETMPSRETRSVVERVLANFWIYQQRFGQETASLDALAAGDWPHYVPQDDPSLAEQ